MTAIISILCTDGVVVAADSAATFSAGAIHTIEQPFDKIDVIDGQVIVAGTGAIGLGQRFCEVVRKHWPQQKKNGAWAIAKAFSGEAVRDFASTNAKQGRYGALVAFGCSGQPYCVEFALDDFQPELKTAKIWYASMGSGQLIIDPFLAFMREVFWQAGPPNLQDGTFAATWLLDHAIAVNPGGVGAPLRIAVLEKDAGGHFLARILDDDELSQHRENVAAAKAHLREFPDRFKPETASDLPDVPKLEA